MRPIPDKVVVCDSRNPVTLVGEPGSMSGWARIQNKQSDKRVVIHSGTLRFALHGERGKGHAAKQHADAIECAATMMAMVAPGQCVDVPIHASLPSTVPAGEHHGELVLGTSTYPAKLLVGETRDTRVAPSQLFVTGGAGHAVKQIYVSNYGNVAVTVGCFGAIPLDNELAECFIIRATLKNPLDSPTTIDEWATRYLREAGKHLEEIGMIWVDTKDGPVDVAPGETVAVELMIRVGRLPSVVSRYSAIVKLLDTNFQIIIVPPGKANGDAHDSVAAAGDAPKARRPK
jgi:hypothetical protein